VSGRLKRVEAIDDKVADVTVIALSGELDASDTSWADEFTSALNAGQERLVVDLLGVTFIDSSFVRELLIAARRIGAEGWLRLVYTHHLIGRVVEICGLAETFPQFTTVDAALRGAPRKLEGGRR
jgi:anti-anti-sigma factor